MEKPLILHIEDRVLNGDRVSRLLLHSYDFAYVNNEKGAAIAGDVNQEKIYRNLPLTLYNLGELEDREILILKDLVELQTIAQRLPKDKQIYIVQTSEYYVIQDEIGTFKKESNPEKILGLTRYMMSGADAGVDFLESTINTFYDNYLNPNSLQLENLEYAAQIYGLPGISIRETSDNFIDLLGKLKEKEIRKLLANSLGWATSGTPVTQSSGIVKLWDDSRVLPVDFVFQGVGFHPLEVGSKGILVNNSTTEYQVIKASEQEIILQGVNNLIEYTVQVGDRLSGVLYDHPGFINAKGRAIADIDFPSTAGEAIFFKNFSSDNYDDYFQKITLENWLDNPLAVDLLIGYKYCLVGVDISQVENPLAVYPFKNIQAGNVSGEIVFEVADSSESIGIWEDFITLKFTYGKLETVIFPQEFRKEDWKGIVGSRGSLLGITFGNSIINLKQKVPAIAEDNIAVTLTENPLEKSKAQIVERYLGAPRRLTHVQHKEAVSELSFSDDYWFNEKYSQSLTIRNEAKIYLSYQNQNLTFVRNTGDLYVNDETTPRVNLGTGVAIGLDQDQRLIKFNNSTVFKADSFDLIPTFSTLDTQAIALNPSHGFYLTETGNPSFPVLLKQNGIIIEKLRNESSTNIHQGYLLLWEYPTLIHKGANGYLYQDLLRQKYYFSSLIVSKITADGKIGYSKNSSDYLFFEDDYVVEPRSWSAVNSRVIMPFEDHYLMLTQSGSCLIDRETGSTIINANSNSFLVISSKDLRSQKIIVS